jgi:pimeloyl-ACP methyl ester carboxylesterase
MIVDQVVNNVELALFHARMLSLLRATFPQVSMDLVLRQELTNGFQSVYFPPTPGTVGVYYGGDNTRKIMYLDGVVTSVQAANLVAGYSAYLGLQVINSSNVWIRNNTDTYLGMMSGNHLQFPEYLDLVGYSAGGAVAECLAFRLRQLGNLQKKKVITFGAPRPGGPNVRDALQTVPVARYMTRADPIALIPPRLQDAPQLVAVLPVSVGLSWSNMVHPRGGVVVNSDGTTEDAIEPPDAAISPGLSLADWYFSAEMEPNNPHSLATYVACLLSATNRAVTPKEKKIELAGGEDADEPKRREANKLRDRVATAVAVAQRDQNAQIVNQPAIVLFKPVRQGRIWTVVLGDRIVCQGVREDTCRHLCRAGNDFLRSLPKQGLVDPIALAEQINNFLLFATAPESEWIPKLRTNLDLA